MRKTLLSALALVCGLCAVLAQGVSAQASPARYQLTLETRTTASMFRIPGMESSPMFAEIMRPQRSIEGMAFYKGSAVEPIFVTVPADLGLPQNRLVLRLPRPGPAEPFEEGPGGATIPDMKFEMTTMLYWHPNEAKGPITETVSIDTSTMPKPPAMPRMGEGGMPGMPGMGGMMMPPVLMGEEWAEGSIAQGSEHQVAQDVVGAGDYVLNTGNLTMPLDGFLPPLKVTAPEEMVSVDPAAGVTVQWEPVAGARGFLLHATEMISQGEGKMTIITWVSTINKPPDRVRGGSYEQATTIADDLRDGVLLSPMTTSCMIPAGIFSGDGLFTLSLVAVGNDFYSSDTESGLTMRGKIRAEWTAMKMNFGGMPGMGGMGGFGGFGAGADDDSGEE